VTRADPRQTAARDASFWPPHAPPSGGTLETPIGSKPMLLHRTAPLFAFVLSACAAHEGPADPPTPTARVEVKVASVQLVQDCADPPTDAAAEANAKPAADGPAALAQAPVRSQDAPAAGSVASGLMRAEPGWSPPCTQSSMQLSVANAGDQEGRLRIEAVRLLYAPTKTEVGKIDARKPSQWNAGGTYQPWNQVVPAGATVKVGYRIGEPDWSKVDATLGGDADPYARPYMLEVDISIDGITQTVRSPEFVREPVHMIVT